MSALFARALHRDTPRAAVIKADDLPSCDWDTGKSDPYVGIRIYSDVRTVLPRPLPRTPPARNIARDLARLKRRCLASSRRRGAANPRRARSTARRLSRASSTRSGWSTSTCAPAPPTTPLNAKRSVRAGALETHAALPAWLHSMDDKSTNMPSVKNGKLVFRIYDHDKIGRDDFIGQGAHRDAAAAGGQVLDQRPRLG